MIKIVYMKPKAGFREVLRSDTLWGNLCWAIYNVYGNQGASQLQRFFASYDTDNPAWVLSSAFPYKKVSSGYHRFFPKPLLQGERSEQLKNERKKVNEQKFGDPIRAKLATMNEQKKIREQRYINEDQFIALIKGEDNALEAIEKVFWEEQGKKKREDKRSQYHEPKVGTISVTRNAIDRIKGGTLKRNEAGQLFHVPEQYLKDPTNAPQSKEETGLFFLAKVAPDFLPVFEAALRYVQHAGLGGDRNTGKGHFDVEWDDYTALPQISQPNAMTNLSLYAAEKTEVEQFEKATPFRYKLENRQGRLGFINSPAFLKKPLMMFAEGAVFPYLPQANYGRLVNVTTEQQAKEINHILWHNGYSFMVNMHVNDSKPTDQN